MSNNGNNSYRDWGYGGNNQNYDQRRYFRNNDFNNTNNFKNNNNKYNKSNQFGYNADMQFHKFKDSHQQTLRQSKRATRKFRREKNAQKVEKPKENQNRNQNKNIERFQEGNIGVSQQFDAQEQPNLETSIKNTSTSPMVQPNNIELQPTIVPKDLNNTFAEIIAPANIKLENVAKSSLYEENNLKEKESGDSNSTIKRIIPETPNKSSSSSSDSSSDSEPDISKNSINNATPRSSKTKLNKSSVKQKSPEVECLGELERKYSLDDDDNESQDDDNCDSKRTKKFCIICDKKDHTSFQCQMICKNCSEPFHNLKTCPKPANVSVMLQSFMEFCMQQLNNYNSEQRFQMPPNVFHCNSTLTTPLIHTTTDTSNILKKHHGSAKKRKVETDSSESEDDNSDDNSSTDSSSCETRTVQSSSVNKSKRKRKNDFSQVQLPYPLHYNPLMYSQMLQNPFPTNPMNF